MNARTIVITAGAIVALAAPTAAFAGAARSPVHNHAVLSESTLTGSEIGTGRVVELLTAAQLRVQLRKAERLVFKLGAELRASKTRAAALRAELRATKKLVAQLRNQIDEALREARGTVTPTPQVGAQPYLFDYCTDYMSECTPEQLCAIWGIDCHLVPAKPAPVVEPVEPTPAPPVEETPAIVPVEAPTTPADPAFDPYGNDLVS